MRHHGSRSGSDPPENAQAHLEALVRAQYEQCHPDDSYADLKRRARFDKGSKGLLKHWLEIARHRLSEPASEIARDLPGASVRQVQEVSPSHQSERSAA